MTKNALYKMIGLLLLFLLLFMSSGKQLQLDKMRNDLGINDAQDIQDKSPSLVFTTVALGSFRGFIANLLFLRSRRLQEERRYYEVHQLARWIRNLQPKFTGAISFMAWNMSYNISVTFDTPEERWVWVKKGLDLYLDAVRNHSGDPQLYWDLGWLFQHKMGMNLDDANRKYKQQWAILMMQLLSENPDLDKLATVTRNPGILHAKLARMGFHEFTELLQALGMSYMDLVDKVLSSPKPQLPDEFKKYLKKEEWQQEILKFILQCERFRYQPATLTYLLEGIVDLKKIITEVDDEWDFDKFEARFRELWKVPLVLQNRLLLDPKTKEQVVDIIDSFMRDRWAWDVYRLDVRRMKKINDEYGALDWRIAETHAIYWAKVGLEKDPDHVPCRRMVTQAMKDVVDRGKLLYFSTETHKNFEWTYNIDLIDKASEVIEKEIALLPEQSRDTFITGYENFLIDCVVALYVNNQKKKAMVYLEKLKKRQPGNKALNKPLDRYVMEELTQDLASMSEDQMRFAINGFLNTCFQMFLFNDHLQAKTYWDLAKKIHESYSFRTKNNQRMGVRPFLEMASRWKEACIEQFPSNATAIEEFYNSLAGTPPALLKRPDN